MCRSKDDSFLLKEKKIQSGHIKIDQAFEEPVGLQRSATIYEAPQQTETSEENLINAGMEKELEKGPLLKEGEGKEIEIAPILRKAEKSSQKLGDEVRDTKHADMVYESLSRDCTALLNNNCFLVGDSREMKLVKEKIRGLTEVMEQPLKTEGGIQMLRAEILMNLRALMDSCDNYKAAKIRDEKNDTSRRHRLVLSIRESVEPAYRFFSCLSEEKLRSLQAGGAITVGDLMHNSGEVIREDAAEQKEAEDLRTREEFNLLGTMRSVLYRGNDPGGAEGICDGLGELFALLKKEVPKDPKDKQSQKKAIRDQYEKLIDLCDDYDSKHHPRLLSGRVRLDAVRTVRYILRDELENRFGYTADILLNEGGSLKNWESLVRTGPLIITRERYGKASYNTADDGRKMSGMPQELYDRQKEEAEHLKRKFDPAKYEFFSGEAAQENLDTATLSEILGVSDCYLSYEKAVKIDDSGKETKGVVCQQIRMADYRYAEWKDISQLAVYGRQYDKEIRYSEKALQQLSAIALMDLITGVKNRDVSQIRYNAVVTTADNEEVVMIEGVKVDVNPQAFSEDAELDEEAVKLVFNEQKGAMSMAYDMDFADEIIAMDPKVLEEKMSVMGVNLSEGKKTAFLSRFEKVRQMLLSDRDKGVRKTWTEKHGNEKKWKFHGNLAGKEKLPSMIAGEFIVGRYMEGNSLPEEEPLEKNVWMKDGAAIKKAEDKPMSKEEEKQANEKKNEERNALAKKFKSRNIRVEKGQFKGVARQILEKKEQVKKINSFRDADLSSVTKYKASKKGIAEAVAANESLAGMSETFVSISSMLKEYGSLLATAQREYREHWKRTLELKKDDTKTDIEKFVYRNRRDLVAKEKRLVADASSAIEKRVEELGTKAALNEQEKLEHEKLKEYRKLLSAFKDGKLGDIPKDAKVLCEDDLPLREEVEVKDENTGEVTYRYQEYNMRDETASPLFAHEPNIEDLAQGALGDCYAIGSLAAIVEHDPNFIKEMMRDEGNGYVTVRLYNLAGEPQYIRVKKTVPGDEDSKEVDRFAGGALWVQMIEKAFAVSGLTAEMKAFDEYEKEEQEGELLPERTERYDSYCQYKRLQKQGYRSYSSIEGGKTKMALRFFTGAKEEQFTIKTTEDPLELSAKKEKKKEKTDYADDTERITAIVSEIRKAEASGAIMTASSNQEFARKEGEGLTGESMMRGLYSSHAYTLIGIREFNGKDYIALRNPWGSGVAEYDANDMTGAVTLRKAKKDVAGAFLLKPIDFLRFFREYTILKPTV